MGNILLQDNAEVVYQRVAITLLHDMIPKEIEVYVDEMIIKSKDRNGPVIALRTFFERLRKFKMR